jgi:two-component system NtrC family sensor kinase
MQQVRTTQEQLIQSEKLSAVGQFVAGVAHELNNPLSVVKGHAALLLKAAPVGSLADRARKIDQAADRCSRIVGSFLGLARQRPIEHQSVSLDTVVRDALELLAYPLRADGVHVKVDLDPHAPPLWADANQLHQVLVNIVSNAHQAMRETPPPRHLTVTSRFEGKRQRVTLTVADTGPGVPPEIRSRLFEPFFTTKPVGLGTGLGLSICLGIIERHGGTIRVEDRGDGERGAAFAIELPASVDTIDTTAAAPPGPAPRIKGKTVLVVDDDAAVGEVLTEILGVDRHQVEWAANGNVALRRLAEANYDVILSDVRMPELDGRGLYEALKGRQPHLVERLVFVTGDSLDAATLAFLDQNEVPLLHKPFIIGDLLETVQSVLRRAPAGPS